MTVCARTFNQLRCSSPATPYIGVDTWYAYRSHISDRVVRGMADLVVSTATDDAGYRYVWLDAGRPAGAAV
jgi:hypothetical protein